MTDDSSRSLEASAEQMRLALESANVLQFAELLDPNLGWARPTPS